MPVFLLPLLSMLSNYKMYIIGAIIIIFITMVGVHEYNVHTMEATITRQAQQNVTLQVQNQEAAKIVVQQQKDVAAIQTLTKDTIIQQNKGDNTVVVESKKIDIALTNKNNLTDKQLKTLEDFANQETVALFKCFEDISNGKVCDDEKIN